MLPFFLIAFISSASLVLSAPPSLAQTGPSFNCSRATSASEGAICADAALAGLDRSLANAYTAAISGPDGRSVRQSQRDWLDRRDLCGAVVVCLTA